MFQEEKEQEERVLRQVQRVRIKEACQAAVNLLCFSNHCLEQCDVCTPAVELTGRDKG